MESIQRFCGLSSNASSFSIWGYEHKVFNQCFLWIATSVPSHAILLIFSAYVLGVGRKIPSNKSSCLWWFISVVICLLSLVNIVEVILSYALKQIHPPAYILTRTLAFSSWMSFFLVHQKVNVLIRQKYVKMKYFLCTAILILIPVGLQLYNIIMELKYDFTISIIDYCGMGYFGLMLLITLLFIYILCTPLKRTPYGANIPSLTRHATSIQTDDSDQSALLSSSGGQGSYQEAYIKHKKKHADILLGKAEATKNIFSKLSFWWVNKLIMKGYNGQLDKPDDLYVLPDELGTKMIKDCFSNHLRNQRHQSVIHDLSVNTVEDFETRKNVKKKYNISIMKTFHKAFGKNFYSLGIIKVIWDGCGFVGPILLNRLVSFMENQNEPSSHGYYYALGLFLSTFISVLFNLTYQFQVRRVALAFRAGLVTSIYDKTLSVGTSTLSKFTTGQIVNFMSTDTNRVINFTICFHEFWSLPFQIAVCLYLLYQQVGIAFLAGLGFIILLIPLNKYLSYKITQYSKSLMKHKDSRVKLMSEILNGIRIIKLYAWEKHFIEKVTKARTKELSSLRAQKYLDAACVFFWAATPVIISVLTFSVYVFMGNELTAAKVFTSIALFNLLIAPLNAFPWVINGLVEAWVSLKRIQDYLTLEEINLDEYYMKSTLDEGEIGSFEIEKAYFHWGSSVKSDVDKSTENKSQADNDDVDKKQEILNPFKLKDINLYVQKGQLLGITGKVGSGKSSLFSAITAELEKTKGIIYLEEEFTGFAYVTQDPWIQHMTFRDNILFGQPYSYEKYESVIHACALKEDINLLPAKDMTEVGENGVTLSGGQKARLSLARAVYQEKEIYLLDDPIAAVDAHVGSHIFKHCIMGLLKDKIRILSTHHTHYLLQADKVLLMDDGNIIAQGDPKDVLQVTSHEENNVEQQQSSVNEKSTIDDNKLESSSTEDDGKLVEEEKKAKGSVALKIYGTYWKSVGKCLAPSIIVFLTLMQASRNVSDWWLSYWISHTRSTDSNTVYYTIHQLYGQQHVSKSAKYYLTIYGYLAAGNMLFTLFRAFLFAYGGLQAARRLHERLLNTILHAPIPFFDTNPIGRIVNRFSSDVAAIDGSLPFMLNIFFAQAFGVTGTIVLTCYGIPWFAALLVPLSAVYYYTQHYYRRPARDIKRLVTVTQSPVYEHFSETLAGLMTIRAFRETERFTTENERKFDLNQRAQYSALASTIWLRLRLGIISVCIVTCVAILAVIEHHFNSVNPGLVGLAISYALAVTPQLSGLVSVFTESEKQMISVERVMQYVTDTQPEESGKYQNVDESWPQEGVICFRDVGLRYRENLPLVLEDVSLYIRSGEKVSRKMYRKLLIVYVTFDRKKSAKDIDVNIQIGICGRTGSGKSSLLRLLFKTIPLSHGEIIIDGINIDHMPIAQLRSHMSIIPQDPFLFDDTISINLDPTQTHTTFEMMDVLQKCRLAKTVQDLGGLDGSAGPNGQNFSAGQKQLLCLARALLKKSKIICIDEATASVDFETDKLIQETIHEEFDNSTVLTIAHRIDTIMNSDRILVLDAGHIAEFAPPSELMADEQSSFYSLVKEHASSQSF